MYRNCSQVNVIYEVIQSMIINRTALKANDKKINNDLAAKKENVCIFAKK